MQDVTDHTPSGTVILNKAGERTYKSLASRNLQSTGTDSFPEVATEREEERGEKSVWERGRWEGNLFPPFLDTRDYQWLQEREEPTNETEPGIEVSTTVPIG